MITIIEYLTTGMGDGGAETLIKDYALLLDKRKYRVVIVCLGPIDETSANYFRLKDAGIPIHSIYKNRQISRYGIVRKIWNRLIHKRYVSSKLLRLIHTYKADVLHCHLEVLNTIVPIASKIKDLNVLWTCHSQPKVIFKPTKWDSEETAARQLIKKCSLRMIALHEEMRKELNAMFNVDNTIVIHNGVDFDKFRSVQLGKDKIRLSLNIPNEAFVMGHVGRFSPAKNHSYLVDIFNELIKIKPNAFLLMIGTGSLSEIIVKKLEDYGLNGRYCILSHRTDIPILLKAMDVFVFPSLYEGLPVSMVEAQVAGLRTIASNKITEECFFSPNAIPLSVDEPPRRWAEVINDVSLVSDYHRDIELFNMKKEIIRLGAVYEKD